MWLGSYDLVHHRFLAHLIHHQMCPCNRKLEIWYFHGLFRLSASFHFSCDWLLIGLDRSHEEWKEAESGKRPRKEWKEAESASFAPRPLATCHVTDVLKSPWLLVHIGFTPPRLSSLFPPCPCDAVTYTEPSEGRGQETWNISRHVLQPYFCEYSHRPTGGPWPLAAPPPPDLLLRWMIGEYKRVVGLSVKYFPVGMICVVFVGHST